MNTKIASGVYAITNVINGKRYIGSAGQFQFRWNWHRAALRKGEHHSKYLQRAWDKYGENCFRFDVLLVCSVAYAFLYEQRALDTLHPEYNVNPSACGTRGLIWSQESKQKLSVAQQRRFARLSSQERDDLRLLAKKHLHSPDAKQRSADSHQTPEYRAAVRERQLGRRLSPETRSKQSAAQVTAWADPDFRTRREIGLARARSEGRGFKSHTEESRAKMRGKRDLSESARMQLSNRALGNQNRLGAVIPQEMRDRISAKLKGKQRSPEAIARHRATNAAKRAAHTLEER